jgi:adenosylcobinamide-phosphate synthase
MVSSRASRGGRRAASSALALAVDALIGDEPLRPHPVAVFGNAMTALERRLWDDRRLAGLRYATSGIGAAAIAGMVLDRLPGGALAAGYATVAGRGLWGSARAVASALEADDVAGARGLLPALVGRDPAGLSRSEIARAAVESVAENTVDGIVAPALFTAFGGACGALTYRGINTLDSMVGYRDRRYERFGWASARLDDVANLVPSRVTAVLVAVVRPSAASDVWAAVRRDAPSHPSPNAGVAEAAFAAALGVRLGGTSSYRGNVEERPRLGPPGGRHPEARDIVAAVRCSQHVTVALFAALMALAVWRRRCVPSAQAPMTPSIVRPAARHRSGAAG